MHFKKWSGFLAHPVVNIIIATLGLLINIVNVNWDKKNYLIIAPFYYNAIAMAVDSHCVITLQFHHIGECAI